MELVSETKNGYTENFVLGSSFEESYAYAVFNTSNSKVLQELGFMFTKYQELKITQTCMWEDTYNEWGERIYKTSCGYNIDLNNSEPEDRYYEYCPFCGRKRD